MPAVPESQLDLVDAQVATLATIDNDGLPQLTEVWYLHDDGDVRLSLDAARAPRVVVTIEPADVYAVDMNA